VISFDAIKDFWEWLNPQGEGAWSIQERGLRPDAPESAKKAFAEYMEDNRIAKEHGRKR
jgi:hypothetical protein